MGPKRLRRRARRKAGRPRRRRRPRLGAGETRQRLRAALVPARSRVTTRASASAARAERLKRRVTERSSRGSFHRSATTAATAPDFKASSTTRSASTPEPTLTTPTRSGSRPRAWRPGPWAKPVSRPASPACTRSPRRGRPSRLRAITRAAKPRAAATSPGSADAAWWAPAAKPPPSASSTCPHPRQASVGDAGGRAARSVRQASPPRVERNRSTTLFIVCSRTPWAPGRPPPHSSAPAAPAWPGKGWPQRRRRNGCARPGTGSARAA